MSEEKTSCLCCGKVGPWKTRLEEQPSVYVCMACHDATLRADEFQVRLAAALAAKEKAEAALSGDDEKWKARMLNDLEQVVRERDEKQKVLNKIWPFLKEEDGDFANTEEYQNAIDLVGEQVERKATGPEGAI